MFQKDNKVGKYCMEFHSFRVHLRSCRKSLVKGGNRATCISFCNFYAISSMFFFVNDLLLCSFWIWDFQGAKLSRRTTTAMERMKSKDCYSLPFTHLGKIWISPRLLCLLWPSPNADWTLPKSLDNAWKESRATSYRLSLQTPSLHYFNLCCHEAGPVGI